LFYLLVFLKMQDQNIHSSVPRDINYIRKLPLEPRSRGFYASHTTTLLIFVVPSSLLMETGEERRGERERRGEMRLRRRGSRL
jgi:hypothetical protein